MPILLLMPFGFSLDIITAHLYFSAVFFKHAADYINRRGFSRAVHAEKGKQLAFLDLERKRR